MYKDENGSSHYMVEAEEPPAMNQHGTLPNSPASYFIRHEPNGTTVEAGAHHQPDIAPINMFVNPCQWPSIEMFGTNINNKRAHFSLQLTSLSDKLSSFAHEISEEHADEPRKKNLSQEIKSNVQLLEENSGLCFQNQKPTKEA
ncbi:hypothetical protein Gotur_020737 [Gossypium turneri]